MTLTLDAQRLAIDFGVDPRLMAERCDKPCVQASDVLQYMADHPPAPRGVSACDGARVWQPAEDPAERFEPGTFGSEPFRLRGYQREALDAVFAGTGAQSGIVVVPCRGGKTVIAMEIARRVRLPVLVVVSHAQSAAQWKAEALRCGMAADDVAIIGTDAFDWRYPFPVPLVIATYHMLIGEEDNRRSDNLNMILAVRARALGCLFFDECHCVASREFCKLPSFSANLKVGLTASLVREDDGVDAIKTTLIGPVLYEVPLERLIGEGVARRMSILNVRVPLTACAQRGLKLATNQHQQDCLQAMHAHKVAVLAGIARHHLARRDHILVFCDVISPIDFLKRALERRGIAVFATVSGATALECRHEVFRRFRNEPSGALVLLTKVADNSIDVGKASVIVEMSVVSGSRNQIQQRSGRILRVDASRESVSCVMYVLFTTGTREEAFAAKRSEYMRDYGIPSRMLDASELRLSLPPIDEDEEAQGVRDIAAAAARADDAAAASPARQTAATQATNRLFREEKHAKHARAQRRGGPERERERRGDDA